MRGARQGRLHYREDLGQQRQLRAVQRAQVEDAVDRAVRRAEQVVVAGGHHVGAVGGEPGGDLGRSTLAVAEEDEAPSGQDGRGVRGGVGLREDDRPQCTAPGSLTEGRRR